MNRYLHIKVFSFVPKVDLTFRIGHMSDDISYYELLQPIIYKYNANIRIRIGFWVANIQIQYFVFVSALEIKIKTRQRYIGTCSYVMHIITMQDPLNLLL